jgi:hypothetical protein
MFVCKVKNPNSYYSESLFLNLPFPRQTGTIVSGFARTLEVIYQVHFGGKKVVASDDRFHER